MLKKLVFCLLFYLLLSPVSCSASNVSGVMVGNNYYENLEDAIENASSGDVVMLMSDVTLDSNLVIDKIVNINLNQNNILSDEAVFLVEGGTLNISGNGTLKENKPYNGVIKIIGSSSSESDYSVVNVEKGVLLEGWSGISISHRGAKSYGVVVNFDGKINAVSDINGDSGIGIYVNGYISDKSNSPVINILDNAEIRSNGVGLYIAGYSTFNIKKAYIQGKESGIGIKSGILNIDGARVLCDGEDKTPTDGYNNGIKSSGTTIQIESNSGYRGDMEININSGEFRSINSNVLYEYIGKGSNTLVNSINISGGKFISDDNKNVFLLSNSFKNKHSKFIGGGEYSSNPEQYLLSGYNANLENNLYKVSKNNMRSVFLESVDSNSFTSIFIVLLILVFGGVIFIYRNWLFSRLTKLVDWYFK